MPVVQVTHSLIQTRRNRPIHSRILESSRFHTHRLFIPRAFILRSFRLRSSREDCRLNGTIGKFIGILRRTLTNWYLTRSGAQSTTTHQHAAQKHCRTRCRQTRATLEVFSVFSLHLEVADPRSDVYRRLLFFSVFVGKLMPGSDPKVN